MDCKSILCLTVLLVLSVASVSSGNKKLNCIKGKYEESLGQEFTNCCNDSRSLSIPKIKKCWIKVMKAEGVVKTASNGQMTVDRENFGDFGRNKNSIVGGAMVNCYTPHPAGDDMYKEVKTASNGQMTVDRENFGDFGRNKNSIVGGAMVNCYTPHPAGDDMYKEAARASQCVFEKVKTAC